MNCSMTSCYECVCINGSAIFREQYARLKFGTYKCDTGIYKTAAWRHAVHVFLSIALLVLAAVYICEVWGLITMTLWRMNRSITSCCTCFCTNSSAIFWQQEQVCCLSACNSASETSRHPYMYITALSVCPCSSVQRRVRARRLRCSWDLPLFPVGSAPGIPRELSHLLRGWAPWA